MAVLLAVCFAYCARAEEYFIKARIIDFTPNDGFMDAGSSVNPYVIQNSMGNTYGTIHSRSTDFNPGDGFFESGSNANPYVFEWNK